MAGDYTRLTFDPRRDRAMVLEQQGRVHLDADFNELVAILERRLRVETYDFAGPAVVGASEPDAFKIVNAGGHMAVTRGRIYVDGLLAENHGRGNLGYEPVWGEPVGGLTTQLELQPYLGSAATGKKLIDELKKGAYLVYLDVWQRELTAVEDASIVEPALGVDTCTRVQTVWQIGALAVGKNAQCSDDWSKFGPWTTLIAPSAGRLTSWADAPPAPADPCAVAPVVGYRGTENRLYRVEVHNGGGAGEATIKWSRDNGAVATAIAGPIANPTTKPIVTVQRLGRDDVLRFAANDWVELLDDARELDGVPGIIAQVDSIDVSQSTVTLTAPLTDTIDPARNPRLRRWDQTTGLTGGVIPITTFGTTIALESGVNVKLELAEPQGVVHTGDWWIFAARAATASIEELDAAPPRGIRHHYARLAIVASDKVQDDCRVVFPGDCKCDGPDCGCTVCVTPRSHADDAGPLTIQKAIDQVAKTGGRVCLTAGGYRLQRPLRIEGARALTLSGEGARTMIVYEGEGLGVAVRDSVGVTLERFAIAVSRASTAKQQIDPSGVQLQVRDVVPARVPIQGAAPIGEQTVAVALVNTADCRVDRCFVVSGFAPGAGAKASIPGSLGIGLGGWALRTRLVENVVFGDVAIGDLTVGRAGIATTFGFDHLGLASGYFASVQLAISDNVLLALSTGVDFGSLPELPGGQQAAAQRNAALGPMLHVGDTRIADNLIVGPRVAGIAMLGTAGGARARMAQAVPPATASGKSTRGEVAPPLTGAEPTHTASSAAVLFGDALAHGTDRLEISGNVLDLGGIGIAVAPGNVRIDDNDITGATAPRRVGSGGILVTLGSAAGARSLITGNTIRNVAMFGIGWGGAPGAVEIRGNRLTSIGQYGIAGAFSSRIEMATIRDNTIEGVAANDGRIAYGIQIPAAGVAEVRSNTIVDVGSDTTPASRAGILVAGCQIAQVTDNVLLRIGPTGQHVGVVYGIAYGGLLDALDIRGNVVELGGSSEAGSDIAVIVLGLKDPLAALKDTIVASNDHMIVLADAMRQHNPAVMIPIIERAPGVTRSGSLVAAEHADSDQVPPRAGDIAVLDNVLRTTSAAPIVLIETDANVTFGQNRVARDSPLSGTSAVVARATGATIVSSNRVEIAPGPGGPPAMALFVGSPSGNEIPHCTVVGNISSQPVWLNGGPLNDPWAPLNLVA